MVLTVGTDCSGIEAPIQALIKLKIPFRHLWSCEIDKYARESIKANYHPEVLFEDITKPRKLPKVDLYVAGFPCQTFSMAGDRAGMDDPRGLIFFHCLKAIKQSTPKVFILENVRGLLSHDEGKTFKIILNHLERLKEYKIQYKILNTKDYGIPQSRNRIYIVGIHKNYKINFEWPKPVKCKELITYVDTSVKSDKILLSERQNNYLNKNCNNKIFVDFCWIGYDNIYSSDYIPCIAARCDLYCIPMKRFATVKELLSLQGFPKSFKQVVSNAQLKKQIGNSMSVNVLCALFKNLNIDKI